MSKRKPEPISGFQGEYRFLSNFWMCTVNIGGLKFPSAEHAYQASKSSFPEIWFKMLKLSSPFQAKRLGKNIPIRPNFDEMKLSFMEEIVTAKFHQNRALGNLLLDTDDREIIETNTWNDTYWGVCNGWGQNHLGKILMNVRNDLQIERAMENDTR